jgi:ribosomal protein S18 acetylase RimI-like enzyme
MAFLLKAFLFSTILLSAHADPYQVQIDHELEETEAISQGLRDYNTGFLGHHETIHFAVYLKDENEQVIGGVIAWVRSGIQLLYIDTIWLSEEARNQGYGKKLMLAAEAEGKKHGCTHAQVDTLSFQAEPFYRKLGYKRIGVVKKLYNEHDAIFMRKNLTKK